MNDQEAPAITPWYPPFWTPEQPFDPREHIQNIAKSGAPRLYLFAKDRLVWFLEDQHRALTQGSATRPFALKTEPVEINHEQGYAVFQTTARDVWGNESVEVGWCSKGEWADYIGKAATKSKARALAAIGYGTANALEFEDEDTPAEAPIAATGQAPASGKRSRKEPPPTLESIKQEAIAAGYETAEERKAVWEAAGVTMSQTASPGDLWKVRKYLRSHPKAQAS